MFREIFIVFVFSKMLEADAVQTFDWISPDVKTKWVSLIIPT